MVDRKYYDYVVEGMRRAVTGGTCRSAETPNYEVCGKTGTAQNPHGRDHSAFMGFAPKDDPKIAICVYVENGEWGATYGVPIGALMMEQYINGHLSAASEERAQSFQERHIIKQSEDE
jgi:penicillin-binding protein 2